MKKNIHPKYHVAKVTCACGNTFEVGSTEPVLRIELCSSCHPFYTGKQKFVDTARRVEKFKEKAVAAAKTTGARTKSDKEKERKAKRATKAATAK